MKSIENILYEARPFMYAAIAALAMIGSGDSRLLFNSGVLLGIASFLVFRARIKHRTQDTR